MEEFVFQIKSNRIVRYLVFSGFILLSYVLSTGSLMTAGLVAGGMVLGRISYNDAVEDLEV